MSVKVTRQAWKSHTRTAADRLVLLSLADYANDSGVCWPSISALAERCELSERSISRSLLSLSEDGLIAVQKRPNASNHYEVLRPRRGDKMSPQSTRARGDNLSPPRHDRLSPQESIPEMPLLAAPKRSLGIEPSDTLRIENPLPPRDDVEALCEQLAAAMVSNGCRKPTITKAWRDEARRLLDKDGIDFDIARAVLAWSQIDDFWKANIHSMRKFRAKFDTLKLRAERTPHAIPVSEDSIAEWLRECWRSADVQSVETRSGLTYEQPDIPEELTSRDEVAEWRRIQRRNWIDKNRQTITTRTLRRTGAK